MYQQNNIEFRIASAQAMSRFKATQANSFIQICRKEFEFGISSREVVLLSYDKFSGWLLKLERMMVAETGKTPSGELLMTSFRLFEEELDKIEEICGANPDVFDACVRDLLKTIHVYSKHVFANAIMAAQTRSPSRAFTYLADLISDYLQHVVIAMHEYNNNLVLKKDPFICVTPFSLLAKAPRYVSLRNRATFYRERIANPSQPFTLKNYTDEDLSIELIRILSEIDIRSKTEELVESGA